MTKTLTENRWFYTENGIKDASWNIVFKSEVLAPVPSYNKVKGMSQKIERLEFDNEVLDMSYSQAKEIIIKLEKQLAITTKALEELELKSDKFYGCNDWSIEEQLDFIKARCSETLYQIKEVK